MEKKMENEQISNLRKEIANLTKIDFRRSMKSCPEITEWKSMQINKRLQQIQEIKLGKKPNIWKKNDTPQV